MPLEPDKQNMIMTTYCTKLNQIKSMLVKTVSPYLALQPVKVFPDVYSYSISLNSSLCLRTRHKSLKSLINTKKCRRK